MTASADLELGFMSATEMVERFRAKSLSPVEVNAAIERRIAKLEPEINAFRFPPIIFLRIAGKTTELASPSQIASPALDPFSRRAHAAFALA